MNAAEQIAALGTALRQMLEATHKLSDIYDVIWVKMSDEEMGLIRACWADMDAAVALPVPTPADLATLARWAEIGRLVEMMPDCSAIQHIHDEDEPDLEWDFSQQDVEGFWGTAASGPDPLSALRAALQPQGPSK